MLRKSAEYTLGAPRVFLRWRFLVAEIERQGPMYPNSGPPHIRALCGVSEVWGNLRSSASGRSAVSRFEFLNSRFWEPCIPLQPSTRPPQTAMEKKKSQMGYLDEKHLESSHCSFQCLGRHCTADPLSSIPSKLVCRSPTIDLFFGSRSQSSPYHADLALVSDVS